MSQEDIAYEKELGNINIRGKRGKNKVPFDVKPVAAEVYQGKIDATDIPLNLDITLDNIDVVANDKSKPLDLGIKPIAAEVDTRKIDKDIPLYVATPTKYGGELPEVVVEGQRPKQPTTEESNAKRAAYAEKLFEMATPYMTGPQASEETVNKSHSIYDIEKERQAARDKEKEEANELGRLYVEGRKYGLDKLMEEANAEPSVEKPVVDENVEIIDDTLEKEAMPSDVKAEKAKEEDPLKFLSDYVNNLWTKEDEEAAAKKKKAAQWILAAQMLGDSLGALSNVYWTGKGANAQKFEPGAPKAAAATYQLEQDIRNAREKAAKAKVDATLQMFKMKMDEKRYADALKQQGIENTIKLGNLEISRAKLANDMDYQKQMLDLRAKELIQNGVKADQAFKLSMEELGLKKEQIKLDKDELQARINGTYYSGSGRGSKLDPVQTSQGDMLIDESKLNATNLAQYEELAAQSGDDGLAKAIRNLDGGTRSITALKQELGRLLNDPANKAIVDHMVSNGILVTNTKSGQNNGGKILGLK